MAKGKSSRPRYGRFEVAFDPLRFHPDLFRIGEGEQALDNKYPILEMMRLVKAAFDVHRAKIPKGRVQEFEDKILGALQNAALTEIHHESETRLLNTLLTAREISRATFEKHFGLEQQWYGEKIREAGFGAAASMQTIEAAITPRSRGRPSKKLLPDESYMRDWQVIMTANTLVAPPFDEHGYLDQLLNVIPRSVEMALTNGILPGLGDQKEPWRAKAAHVDRISRRARRFFEGNRR